MFASLTYQHAHFVVVFLCLGNIIVTDPENISNFKNCTIFTFHQDVFYVCRVTEDLMGSKDPKETREKKGTG